MFWFGDELYNLYNSVNLEESEKTAEIEFLLEVVGGIKYKDYILGKRISDDKKELIVSYIRQRTETDRPIQQIVGKSFFAGELFCVNENTLIPRPETELIIEVLKDYFSENEKFGMLDIGSGTGCISIIAAKNFRQANILGCDNCQECIDTCQKNADLLNCSNVNFRLSDVFSDIKDRFDVIVSNPPYISYSDKTQVQDNVLRFEPHNALFAENDGYYFYEKIISETHNYLCGKSVLIFEIGINQEKRICELLKDNSFSEIRIKKDFNNINRIISAKYSH